MRYNFELTDSKMDSSRLSVTPNDDIQWVPLKSHPAFTPSAVADGEDAASPAPRNLLAWDGSSRLYYWDSNKRCLHRISIRLGQPEPTSVLGATPSKVLQTDVKIDFVVTKISINRNGSALLASGWFR